MDSSWFERTAALEADVRKAVAALLDHTRASGTVLEVPRPGRPEPTFVVIGEDHTLDDLLQLVGGELQTDGSAPSAELLDQLPDPLREAVESEVERGPKRRH